MGLSQFAHKLAVVLLLLTLRVLVGKLKTPWKCLLMFVNRHSTQVCWNLCRARRRCATIKFAKNVIGVRLELAIEYTQAYVQKKERMNQHMGFLNICICTHNIFVDLVNGVRYMLR